MTKDAGYHRCHWPTCRRFVLPRFWGCRPHWQALPRAIQKAIWEAYRPGQELDKQPSAAYLLAADQAERYAREQIAAEEAGAREAR